MKKTNESVDVCRERKKSSLSFKLSYLLGWVKSFGPTSMRVFWREVRRCWTESAKRGFEWACTSPSAIVLVNVSEILTRPLGEKDYRLELLIITTCWLGTQTSSIREQASWKKEDGQSFKEQTNITNGKQDTIESSIWPAIHSSLRIFTEYSPWCRRMDVHSDGNLI